MPKSFRRVLISVDVIGQARIQTLLWRQHVWMDTGAIVITKKSGFDFVAPCFSHVFLKNTFNFKFQIPKTLEPVYLKLVCIYDCLPKGSASYPQVVDFSWALLNKYSFNKKSSSWGHKQHVFSNLRQEQSFILFTSRNMASPIKLPKA